MAEQIGQRTFLDNRHPEYKANADEWQFLNVSYIGGQEYTAAKNLFRFSREREEAYKARLARTCRVNYTAQVIDLIVSYLMKQPPTRKSEGVPNALIEFWKDADGLGTSMNDYMEEIATQTAINGIYYVVVDKPAEPNLTGTVLEKQEKGLKPYCYGVSPLDMLDIVFDAKTGRVKQALVRELVRVDSDLSQKRESDGLKERFRLWQETASGVVWRLYEKGEKGEPVQMDEGALAIKRVPIVPVRRRRGRQRNFYVGKSMAADFAYLDRSIYNYESCLDQIIYDQTFSVLALEYDGSFDAFYKEWDKTMSTKSIIPFKKDGAPPTYISPDASQGSLISESIEKKTNQIYRLSNLLSEVGEAQGVQGQESGVAKAYEFEKLNAVLGKFADILEGAEKEIARLVLLFEGEAETIPDDLVDYPDTFDVKSLMQELTEYHQIALAAISAKFEAHLKKKLVRKIDPKIEKKLLKEIDDEIDNPPEVDPAADEVRRLRGE